MLVRFNVVIFSIFIIFLPNGAFGQESNHITLRITLDGSDVIKNKKFENIEKWEHVPRLLVFSNGNFIGIAPGYLGIELDPLKTIIEIGLPEFKDAPLYSFVISNKNLNDKTVSVNYSTIDYKIVDLKNKLYMLKIRL